MNRLSGPVVSAALTPIVWIRTPIARAASAATSGDGWPVLLAPSVMSTITLAVRQILELGEAHRERRADRGAVGQHPDVDPPEHPLEEIGVGRERRLEKGAAGEDHQPEQVALAVGG